MTTLPDAADTPVQPWSDCLDAALAYARWGWRVLPVEPGGKRAFLRDWPNRASDDPAVIRSWWARMPECNIGVLTGGPSGIVAVDVDGERGAYWWRRLAVTFGLPDTATVFTPRGGHYLFQHPGPPVPCSAGRVAEGVDVRGERGYIVSPPSVRDDGGRYVWGRGSTDRPTCHRGSSRPSTSRTAGPSGPSSPCRPTT